MKHCLYANITPFCKIYFYKSVAMKPHRFDRISTWNQTDFQTHFAPILDLLSDCFDFEHVENI